MFRCFHSRKRFCRVVVCRVVAVSVWPPMGWSTHSVRQCVSKLGHHWSRYCQLGLYSLSGKTSYRQISWSLEAARLDVAMVVSLWNLTSTSAAALPRYLPNFRAIGKVYTRISRLRDFTRSCVKTSYRLVNRGPGLLAVRCHITLWTNTSSLSGGTNFSEIWLQIQQFSYMHMQLKVPSAK